MSDASRSLMSWERDRFEARRMTVTRQKRQGLVPWVAGLAGVLWFHRAAIFSGFDRVQGIRSDTRLVVFIHEHWWQVVRGEVSWLSPRFFFPATGTLGYSDTFFLDQFFYVPLRALGFGPFTSFSLTMIGMSAVGYLGYYLLLRRVVSSSILVATLGAVIAAFGNALYTQTTHPQLMSVQWLPWIILGAASAVRTSGPRSLMLSAASGLGAALLLWSAFYVAWFAILAALIAGLAVVMLLGPSRAWRGLLVRWRLTGAWLAGWGAGLVPFFLTYGPVLAEKRERPLAESLSFAPNLTDLVRVGRSNMVWGWLVGDAPGGIFGRELLVGFPLVFLLVTLAVTVRTVRSRDVPGMALVSSIVTLLVLPMRFGGRSLWEIAWHVIPGASVIRVTSRAWLLVVPLVVVLVVREWSRASNRSAWPRAVVVCLVSLLVIEQLSWSTTWAVRRHEEEALVRSLGPSPSSCVAILAVGEPGDALFDPTHVDAMMIAMEYGVPTVNGYSGLTPLDYDIDVSSADYEVQVAEWLSSRGVDASPCVADLGTATWRD